MCGLPVVVHVLKAVLKGPSILARPGAQQSECTPSRDDTIRRGYTFSRRQLAARVYGRQHALPLPHHTHCGFDQVASMWQHHFRRGDRCAERGPRSELDDTFCSETYVQIVMDHPRMGIDEEIHRAGRPR